MDLLKYVFILAGFNENKHLKSRNLNIFYLILFKTIKMLAYIKFTVRYKTHENIYFNKMKKNLSKTESLPTRGPFICE